MIYLASPFTSKKQGSDALNQQFDRAKDAAKYAARLWAYLDQPVYSPIAHGYAIEPFMTNEHKEDHDRWMLHCYQMLGRCNELYVLCIDGWRESKGVQLEIVKALELGDRKSVV